MKTRLLALTVITLGMLACATVGVATEAVPATATSAPELTSTEAPESTQKDKPKSSAEVQARLIEEWRPAYETAIILPTICYRIWHTNWNFREGKIDHGQARRELEAEAGLLNYAQQISSSVTAPSESVAPYLERLDALISTLIGVVASGDRALELDAFETIDTAYASAGDLYKEIPAAAEAAGMIDESIYTLNDEIFPVSDKLHDDDEWMTLVPEPKATPLGQEALKALKDEWRPAYNQGALLFETCTMIYQTQADFGQGEIDLERAKVELEAEAEFVGSVQQTISSVVAPSKAVAPHLTQIEGKTKELLKLLEADDNEIGTPEVLDAVGITCNSLQDRMDAIVADARAAGMSPAALDELDREISPMIDDLYNRTWYGR